MKRGADFFVILFAALAIASCHKSRPGSLMPQPYVTYMESVNNDYRKEINTGKLTYTIQYKPAAYIALKENGAANTAAVTSRASMLHHTAWFNIQLSVKGSKVDPLRDNAGNEEEYTRRTRYFSNTAGKNITLLYAGKPATQLACYFENNFGLTPYDRIIVGFSIPDSTAIQPLQLTYYDGLFSSGIIKMSINKDALTAIPKLIFY